jgi:hypothetical protein
MMLASTIPSGGSDKEDEKPKSVSFESLQGLLSTPTS